VTIAIAKTKGGMGGSTLAWNLGIEYAQRGGRVLEIDTDSLQPLIDAERVRPLPPALTLMAWPHPSLWEDMPRLGAGQDFRLLDGQGHNPVITRAVVTAAALDPHGVIVVPVMATAANVRATKREMRPILATARGLVSWRLRIRTLLIGYTEGEIATKGALEALTEETSAPPGDQEPPVPWLTLAPLTRTNITRSTLYGRTLSEGLAVCELAPGGAHAREIADVATEIAALALTDPEPRESDE
jgi:hypothetical protein